MGNFFYLNSFVRNFIKFPLGKAKIKILCNDRFEPFIHQQCDKFGIYNNVKFITSGNADLIIVLNRFDKIEEYVCSGVPIILWLVEPPDYFSYYTNNFNHTHFDKIYTCKYLLGVPKSKQIITPPFVHWHHAYNSKVRYLKNGFMPFAKTVLDGIVSSKLDRVFVLDSHINNIPGHQNRINFINKIDNTKIDLFGSYLWKDHKSFKGSLPSFKYNLQKQYRYSLVIENQLDDIYWSEKITDSFLASSFPIYFGSKSITKFFPESSFLMLDNLNANNLDFDYLFKNMHDIINVKAMAEARNLVLHDYNMFNIFSKLLI